MGQVQSRVGCVYSLYRKSNFFPLVLEMKRERERESFKHQNLICDEFVTFQVTDY